jgi:hypothetical protein
MTVTCSHVQSGKGATSVVWDAGFCYFQLELVTQLRPMTHLSPPSCITFIESRKSAPRIHSTQVYRTISPGCHIPLSFDERRPLHGIQEPDTWKETISGAAHRGYAGGRTISRRMGGSDDKDKWCPCNSAFPYPMMKTSIGRSSSTGTSNFKISFEASLETQSG